MHHVRDSQTLWHYNPRHPLWWVATLLVVLVASPSLTMHSMGLCGPQNEWPSEASIWFLEAHWKWLPKTRIGL